MARLSALKVATPPLLHGAPIWHLPPDGDRLVGLDSITAYLGIPFLRVRELHNIAYIPTSRIGRAIVASRRELDAHFFSLERCAGHARFMPEDPAPITGDLIRRHSDIAAYLQRATESAVRHHIAVNGLPAFMIGRIAYARRSSLDRWSAAEGWKKTWDRRRERAATSEGTN
ncbi:hypothetical protein ACVOMT_16690 [Sphingomonas panni]